MRMTSIYHKLLLLLSYPPARTGLRLKSERELAKVLNIHPRSANYALTQLEEAGIIERRQGVGSFVRKIPFCTPLPEGNPGIDLFLTSANGNWLVESEKPIRPFEVALWGIGANNQYAECQFRQGVLDRLERDGHHLTTFSFSLMEDSDREEALRQAYANANQHFDASLVMTSVAEAFDALGQGASHPRLYVSNAPPMLIDPLARYDFFEMFSRVGLIFVEKRIQRAASIGLRLGKRIDDVHFRWACHSSGLNCVAAENAELNIASAQEVVDRIFPMGDRARWPDGLFVADDILLHLLCPFLLRNGVRPGENVAVVTHSNTGQPLPGPYAWSRLEFNPYRFGRHCAENLLHPMLHAGEMIQSFAATCTWIPGATMDLKTGRMTK